jgi:hypothetical protein
VPHHRLHNQAADEYNADNQPDGHNSYIYDFSAQIKLAPGENRNHRNQRNGKQVLEQQYRKRLAAHRRLQFIPLGQQVQIAGTGRHRKQQARHSNRQNAPRGNAEQDWKQHCRDNQNLGRAETKNSIAHLPKPARV